MLVHFFEGLRRKAFPEYPPQFQPYPYSRIHHLEANVHVKDSGFDFSMPTPGLLTLQSVEQIPSNAVMAVTFPHKKPNVFSLTASQDLANGLVYNLNPRGAIHISWRTGSSYRPDEALGDNFYHRRIIVRPNNPLWNVYTDETLQDLPYFQIKPPQSGLFRLR